MHVYIYDDYLNKGRFNRAVNRMEIRLTDLGLNGKIIRLSGIKNIKGTIQNEIRLGAKTIVAVGNNQTINKIIGAIIEADVYLDFQKNTLLGIVPIGDDNSIAASFGIQNEEEACNILLARRIEKIDLGLAGGYYFLNEARIQSLGTKLIFNDYYIEAQERGEIKIINLLSQRINKINSNPHDGLLDIFIKTKKSDETLLRVKNFSVISEKNFLILDNVVEVKTPIEIKVVGSRINVIVGKNRSFE